MSSQTVTSGAVHVTLHLLPSPTCWKTGAHAAQPVNLNTSLFPAAGSGLLSLQALLDPLSLRLDVDGASKQDLTTAVDGLSETERLIVSLYFLEELTIQEIASVLSLSDSRVFQLGLRAMERIRTHLDQAPVKA